VLLFGFSPESAAQQLKNRVGQCVLTSPGSACYAGVEADKRIGLGKKALVAILSENARFVGAAPHQVDAFVEDVKPLAKKYKGSADYQPGRLL